MMLKHVIENLDQLAHAGINGQFLGLARCAKVLVEATDHWVKASGDAWPWTHRSLHRSALELCQPPYSLPDLARCGLGLPRQLFGL
jgi:hypothetical protein